MFDIPGEGGKVGGMYEASGKIKMIGEVQKFPSGFTKREFVVTTADKFPQDLKFETVKDKCAMLDSFRLGDEVQVNFDIRGNEYNGKYFVNLSCWKVQNASGADAPSSRDSGPAHGKSAPQADGEPSMKDLRNEDDWDDVPF